MMANDISYTAFGRFTNTHLDVLLALDHPGFSLVKAYNLSQRIGGKIYNAILLHVDNGATNDVISSTFSFPVSLEISNIDRHNNPNVIDFDTNYPELLLFVAHEKATLGLDIDNFLREIPVKYNEVKSRGNFSTDYKKTDVNFTPPQRIGVSIIRK